MIRNYWVQNFLSIRDRQELNFIAKGPESELVAKMENGEHIYKLGILFGPNASGKSNMLWAIYSTFFLLIHPRTKEDEKIKCFMPFALAKEKPTQMSVSFYADGIRYDYFIEYSRKTILKEKLYYYPNGSKALFYERNFVDENVQANIKFGSTLGLKTKTKENIKNNTLNNHSVLSVCQKNTFTKDIEPFTRLYKWVMAYYHDIDGDFSERGIVEILEEAYNNERKRKFFNQMLKKADLNIAGFHPIIKDRDVPKGIQEQIKRDDLCDKVKEELLSPTVKSFIFENHSDNGNFEIPLGWQSNGTVKYIRILDILYNLTSGNHVYYLDELGEDLHYDLLIYYLNLFLFNSNQSQLIITSQEIALLLQDYINENRGAIWFVDKNKETASSEYSRGDSFGLHKNLSLYNSYSIGRLGAKPQLGSFFLDIEE